MGFSSRSRALELRSGRPSPTRDDPLSSKSRVSTHARGAMSSLKRCEWPAEIMTAKHFRHLPVASDAGLLGVIDVTDVCRALSKLETAG